MENGEVEKIVDVLQTIEETASQYIEWTDILSFFSEKGYTKQDQEDELQVQSNKKDER